MHVHVIGPVVISPPLASYIDKGLPSPNKGRVIPDAVAVISDPHIPALRSIFAI